MHTKRMYVSRDNDINDSDILGLGKTWLRKESVNNFEGFKAILLTLARVKELLLTVRWN